MRLIRAFLAVLLVTLAPAGVAAQESEIVVRGETARVEIQRILDADNLDTGLLDARAIADALMQIERGRSPEDFWMAYSAHVRAWRDYADAYDDARRVADNPDAVSYAMIRAAQAEQRIEKTFDEVERIALSYGARMPIPPAEMRQAT